MAIKSEISWRRYDAEGQKVEVYARRFGGEWEFHQRHRRNDQWQLIPEPGVEDFLTLLDAVSRRVARSLYPLDEINRIRALILNRFPGQELPDHPFKHRPRKA